jgi:hypothetical protein
VWVLPVTLSDRRLRIAAVVVVLLHLTLVVTVEWAMFESLLVRALGGVQQGSAARFAAPVGRTVTIELAALVMSGFAAIGMLGSPRARLNAARFVSVFLIAWSPVALYSAGILLALAGGWEPDVQIFSSREATDAEVADTIREAMPVIMQPITTGRHVANGMAMLLLAVLQYRLCGIDAKRSIAAAAAAGIIGTLAVLLT